MSLYKKTLATALVTSILILSGTSSWASSPSPSPSASPSPSSTSSANTANPGTDFKSVCSKALDTLERPTALDGAPFGVLQKIEYCKAAKAAKDAASTQGVLWKVWAGVAGVCTTTCLTSFMGKEGSLGGVCTGATIGGTATDAIATRKFAESLTSLGGLVAGSVINRSISNNKPDVAACLSAASATLQSFAKRKAEQSSKDLLNQNLENARKFADPTETSEPSTIPSPDPKGTGTNLGSGLGGGGGAIPQGNAITRIGNPNIPGGRPGGAGGGGCTSESSAGAMLACARARDPKLPGFIANPKFGAELSKNSGLSPDAFLKRSNDPADAVLRASGGAGLNAKGLETYASLLDQAAKLSDNDAEGGAYSQGAGAGPGSAPSDAGDAEMNAMMAGLLKQLNPDGSEEKEKEDGTGMDFAQREGRAPAYNADDPSFSIFERVSYRYWSVSPRLVQ